MSAGIDALSVVVIGRNEGERLVHCLRSVRAMDTGGLRVELIYVDSASSDGSMQAAQREGAVAIALDTTRPNAAKARNAGWRAAGAPLILFLDGDTMLQPRFVADSLADFADPAVAVVWGHRREVHPERSVYNRVLDLDWVYAPGPSQFCGGDALFRRDVLEKTGGFNEGLIAGEEPELCRRIIADGGIVLHVDRPMTGHDLAIYRFTQYWKRAVRAGHAYAEVAQLFRAQGSSFWTDEVTRNRNRAAVLMGLTIAGVVGSALLRSVLPVSFVMVALVLLSVRSAWRARWKGGSAMTLLLYGAHSHFQQIPIAVGQVRYRSRPSSAPEIVEYK